ncbi:DUF4913 domain-containing protein [Kitasatospora sp. NPDC057542]|uniref:DUF4913 domain-containing protein n=1 Tax=Streptomycetaceae TaxID=2062 RepID=UPI0035A8F9BB
MERVIGRLHALWLARQQLTTAEAGHVGPSTWHRDHLGHTLLQLRGPDRRFAVCTAPPARRGRPTVFCPPPTS